MKISVALLFAIVGCGLLSCNAASTEGMIPVKLNKKALEVSRIKEQREIMHKKYALGASNEGEDVPLVDFMDAQVCHWSRRRCNCIVSLRRDNTFMNFGPVRANPSTLALLE